MANNLNTKTVYFAGPLFTHAEKNWNLGLAHAMTSREPLISLFLPQTETASALLENPPNFAEVQRKCLNGIDSSDVIVAILDGPDSDSGTCFECGYGFAKGKPIIGIRTDTRGSGEEKGLNAMLAESCEVIITFKVGTGAPEEIDELAEQILSAIWSSLHTS